MNTLKLVRLMAALRGQHLAVSTIPAPRDEQDSIVVHADPSAQISTDSGRTVLHRNVAFARRAVLKGKTRTLKMDIHVPTSPGPHPAIVYLSGGGFAICIKQAARSQRAFVAEAGFVVASIQYRIVGDGARYLDGVADVKAAIRFLRNRAEVYDVDPRAVGVWGESAGGYLASMAGVTNGRLEFEVGNELEGDSSVQAVLDKFGASDLTSLAAGFDDAAIAANEGADNLVAEYVNGRRSGKALSDDPAAAALANPTTYIGPETPPFLLFHGSNDRIVSPEQTSLLHQALLRAGVESTRYLVDGAGHGDLSVVGGDGKLWTTPTVMDPMVDFFNKTLRA